MMDVLSSRTVPFGMKRSAIGLFFSFLFSDLYLFIFLAIRLLSYPKNNENSSFGMIYDFSDFPKNILIFIFYFIF